jgi:hypothetical protein
MEIDYRSVSIYVDSTNNFLIVPTGSSLKWGIIEIGIINELKQPYSDQEMEEELVESMKQCHSKPPEELSSISMIEQYLGIKGYERATKGRKLIIFSWNVDDGYYVTPTEKATKGYTILNEKSIYLGHSFEKLILANAIKQALELSSCWMGLCVEEIV